jgi:hypothetical protein
MRSKVYLETSVISYLTAWPSRDLVKAAHQQITQEWWRTRTRFDLYASQVVLSEASSGDPEAARLRLESLSGVPILTASPEASALAQQLVALGSLPAKAAVDAVHIAVAVVNGIDYLLSRSTAACHSFRSADAPAPAGNFPPERGQFPFA